MLYQKLSWLKGPTEIDLSSFCCHLENFLKKVIPFKKAQNNLFLYILYIIWNQGTFKNMLWNNKISKECSIKVENLLDIFLIFFFKIKFEDVMYIQFNYKLYFYELVAPFFCTLFGKNWK
jgi:hypothetical protein